MTYGNKIIIILLLLSFFLVGCKKNFYQELYDGFYIKEVGGVTKLYKDTELITINDIDYKIKEFKYNSDVVILKLDDNSYYMIYYFDSSIYGPYTIDTLNQTIKDNAMNFSSDFMTIDGEYIIYD